MSNESTTLPVQIVGGGVAGINCARHLQQRAIPFRLIEASDGLGGRMRTDPVDGFRLDRGFQVFQSAYPEAKLALDYEALQLVPLIAGALVRRNGKWFSMVDPSRHPGYALGTIFNSIGNLADRLRLGKLLWNALRVPLEHCMDAPNDKSTAELLRDDYGFSSDFIEQFLRPWLSGMFLESKLETSANFFRFVLKMLSTGKVYYPRTGIQAIPDQLASTIAPESIELRRSVQGIEADAIVFEDETRPASQIVLAVPLHQAAQWIGDSLANRTHAATTCVYFAADRAPITKPILMLNGEGDGPVNHVFVLTNASQDIAPAGRALISVSLVGDRNYEPDEVRSQLSNWYGQQVSDWSELAVYRITHALPTQPPGFARKGAAVREHNHIFCGDYCASASLQGALLSGREAAALVPSDFASSRTGN